MKAQDMFIVSGCPTMMLADVEQLFAGVIVAAKIKSDPSIVEQIVESLKQQQKGIYFPVDDEIIAAIEGAKNPQDEVISILTELTDRGQMYRSEISHRHNITEEDRERCFEEAFALVDHNWLVTKEKVLQWMTKNPPQFK